MLNNEFLVLEEDLNRGVQYKVIATVVGENIFDDKLETLQDDFFDSIDDVAMITKENIVTNQHLIYLFGVILKNIQMLGNCIKL